MLLYSSPKKSPFSANQVGAVQVTSRGSTIVVKSGQIGPTLVLLDWFCDRIGNGAPWAEIPEKAPFPPIVEVAGSWVYECAMPFAVASQCIDGMALVRALV